MHGATGVSSPALPFMSSQTRVSIADPSVLQFSASSVAPALDVRKADLIQPPIRVARHNAAIQSTLMVQGNVLLKSPDSQ